jgi:hypothetical protein
VPSAHELLVEPSQVHVSAAAMAFGIGIRSSELKLRNPARIKFINLFILHQYPPH